MRLHLGNIAKLLIVTLALALSNCGKKNKSSDVKISSYPEHPIVYTSPMNVNVGGTLTKIPGPVMGFQLIVDNQVSPAQPVTLMAIHVEVTGTDESGNLTTVSADFDPSFSNYSQPDGTCAFLDFGQFDAGGTATGNPIGTYGTPVNGSPLYSLKGITSSSLTCQTAIPMFYIGSLPTTGPGQVSFNYRVKIVPQGWFGTRSTPVERFTQIVYTTTN